MLTSFFLPVEAPEIVPSLFSKYCIPFFLLFKLVTTAQVELAMRKTRIPSTGDSNKFLPANPLFCS